MRRLACIRRAAVVGDPWDVVVRSLCCPPPEVFEGKPGRVRRSLPGKDATPRRWDIEFFPLKGEDTLLCILGKITPVVLEEAVAQAPLPAGVVNLREQLVQWHSIAQLPTDLPGMRRLAEQIRLAGQTQVPVLILGEAGCRQGMAGSRDSLPRSGPRACLHGPRLPGRCRRPCWPQLSLEKAGHDTGCTAGRVANPSHPSAPSTSTNRHACHETCRTV